MKWINIIFVNPTFIFAGVLGLLFHTHINAQCVSFKLSDRGDTLNCVDKKGMKQGPWIEKKAALRGNPGYEEEGEYRDNKREGLWRRYSEQGDLLAVENYRWGLLHGKSQYYSLMGLEREESWWAINPQYKYDTILVPDLYVDGKYKEVIVPNEGRSLRHGSWTWYDPMTGLIVKTEEFFRDSLSNPLAAFGLNSRRRREPPVDSTGKPKKVEKPDVVTEWEKKNAGKKRIKVRDGSTGY